MSPNIVASYRNFGKRNTPQRRDGRRDFLKEFPLCDHPVSAVYFDRPRLPEGDSKIARQFTAGFESVVASVPQGRLNPPQCIEYGER